MGLVKGERRQQSERKRLKETADRKAEITQHTNQS